MTLRRENVALLSGVGSAVASTLILYLLLGYGIEASAFVGIALGLLIGFVVSR